MIQRLRRLPLRRIATAVPGYSSARHAAIASARHTPTAQAAVRQRAAGLLAVLEPGAELTKDPVLQVLRLLSTAELPEIWLALAVMNAELPLEPEVRSLYRRLRLEDPAALVETLTERLAIHVAKGDTPAQVEIVQGRVTIDVFHTANTHLATGIQRVVREAAQRWDRDHDITLLSWTPDHRALRHLSEAERQTALFGATPQPQSGAATVVVPWRGTHLMPELATEPERTTRMLALARYSRSRSGAIGFDCVPITTSETVFEGMGGAFSLFLSAVREMDRVAAISHAAAREWRGWKTILGGLGVAGPQVQAISLAVSTAEPSAEALQRMRELVAVGNDPIVLVVGSHEPRKNHLAVLHAAELLWREGVRFSLCFIGGNSWNSELFQHQVHLLSQAGRPVTSFSGMSDDDVWAAYHLAALTMFPSINEGFGLPVAESLACGTPAITSAFGSMAEIAEGGGALLVDPHDDTAVANALRRLLTEPGLLHKLATEARNRPVLTWDEYAEQVWAFLVGDQSELQQGGQG